MNDKVTITLEEYMNIADKESDKLIEAIADLPYEIAAGITMAVATFANNIGCEMFSKGTGGRQ